MTISLQICSCDPRVMDKSGFIATSATYSNCVARTPMSLMEPVVSLECPEQTAKMANYASVDGKSYFITDKTSGANGIWTFKLKVDVLFTYSQGILTQQGIVARNKNFYNMYLPDPKVPVMAKKTMNVLAFSQTPLSNKMGDIVLITAGGF